MTLKVNLALTADVRYTLLRVHRPFAKAWELLQSLATAFEVVRTGHSRCADSEVRF